MTSGDETSLVDVLGDELVDAVRVMSNEIGYRKVLFYGRPLTEGEKNLCICEALGELLTLLEGRRA